MPAIVRCPNGCKLQVPVRKLFETFHCPKCSESLQVDHDQVDAFQDNRKHVIRARLSADISDAVPEGVIYIEGSAENQLIEVTENNQHDNSPTENSELDQSHLAKIAANDALPEPPPVVDQGPSDVVFKTETQPFVQPITPPLKPGPAEPIPAPDGKTSAATENPETVISETVIPALPSETLATPTVPDDSVIKESVPIVAPVTADVLPVNGIPTETRTGWLKSFFHDADNPGVFHYPQNCWKAYSLGWAMVVIGVFLLSPVIYTMLQWIGKDYHLPLGRWSLVLIFFSAIQFLYAIFLFQIPDWSSTRFVSYFLLLMTIMSSFMLAVAFLSQEANNLFRFLQLSIINKNIVAGWLTVMSIVFGLMSYLCGRTTQQWVNEEKRLGGIRHSQA